MAEREGEKGRHGDGVMTKKGLFLLLDAFGRRIEFSNSYNTQLSICMPRQTT